MPSERWEGEDDEDDNRVDPRHRETRNLIFMRFCE